MPAHVSKVIEENSLLHLMQKHSMEAGRTLNLLYEINRIGDLRYNCDAMQGKLYHVFIEDFLKQVNKLHKPTQNGAVVASSSPSPSISKAEETLEDSGFYNEAATNTVKPNENSILNNLTTQDNFLLMAFALNTNEEDTVDESDTETDSPGKLESTDQDQEINSRFIYDILQKSKSYLPLEELLISSLTRILKTRIAFANCFVMRLYREEFMVLKHLQNIRKVFLMEASDLMHQFYNKLFQQVS